MSAHDRSKHDQDVQAALVELRRQELRRRLRTAGASIVSAPGGFVAMFLVILSPFWIAKAIVTGDAVWIPVACLGTGLLIMWGITRLWGWIEREDPARTGQTRVDHRP